MLSAIWGESRIKIETTICAKVTAGLSLFPIIKMLSNVSVNNRIVVTELLLIDLICDYVNFVIHLL